MAASPHSDISVPPSANIKHLGRPVVSVVVLNWNGREDTLACLESVSRIRGRGCRVFVADNGSSDGSVAAIRQAYPGVDLIENRANLGFAAGNNEAIARALRDGAEFVFLLNNDTVVDPNIVDAFVDAAQQMPQAGVFGAKIYYHADPQRLWFAGGHWDPRTLSFEEHGAGEIDRGQYDQRAESDWVIGCAMFVRADVFRKIGVLEPAFFLNNEEVDFCSRARRAGFKCVYVPEAKVWHKVSVSFGGADSPLKEYFSARNRLLWARRNAATSLRLRIHGRVWQTLARRLLSPLASRTEGGGGLRSRWWSFRAACVDPRNRAYALGLRDYYLRRFGDCPPRVRELSQVWSRARSARSAASAEAQAR